MRLVLYKSETDTCPQTHEVSWEDLGKSLTTERRVSDCTCHRDGRAPGASNPCRAKYGPAWSPAVLEGKRCSANVRAITAAVFDIDHVTLADLMALAGRVDAAGYTAIVHSTHSHRQEDVCARLVLPLSRECNPREWSQVRATLITKLQIPADPKTGDLSRIYFLPSAPKGAPTIDAFETKGSAVSVDNLLLSVGAPDAPPRPKSVDARPRVDTELAIAVPEGALADMQELRDSLAGYARSRARGSLEDRAKADMVRRVLDHKPLAEEGDRDDTLQRVCCILACLLPLNTPIDAVLELMRASVLGMTDRPEGCWLTGPNGARDKLTRARKDRLERETHQAMENAALRQAVRASTTSGSLNQERAREMLQNITVPYAKWNDDYIVKQIVPLVREFLVPKWLPDGKLLIFSRNNNNEVALQQERSESPLMVISKIFAESGQGVAPPALLKKIERLWRWNAKDLEGDPLPFEFKGSSVTFKRFDWEPTSGNHPAWEEFLTRLSDREAFMAYIWSCFEKQNHSRQYLWLHGPHGQDGKSVVLGVISDVFGTAACALTSAFTRDPRFLLSSMYGKRVAIFSDCRDVDFGKGEIIRNVGSGDPVSIEYKGETAFSASMYVKVLIASNYRPAITGENADRSRCLPIGVRPSTVTDDWSWRAKLVAELPAFLDACRKAYEVRCPNHGNIQESKENKALLDDIVESAEERWASMLEERFTLDPNGSVSASEFCTVLRTHYRLNTREVGEFRSYLDRLGVKRVCQGHNRKRVYKGLSLRRYGVLSAVQP